MNREELSTWRHRSSKGRLPQGVDPGPARHDTRPIDTTASPSPPRRPRAWELPLCAALLGALTLALHGRALAGSWAYDDLRILRHALEFAPWQHFADRHSWQIFSVANLTPLQILSYQLDLARACLSRPAFAAHQLIALWAAADRTGGG